MTETKLQSLIAITFSQKYPEKSGQLFHVSNERSNRTTAFIARSIGIIPGVADFIFFSKKFNVAIELKIKGSRHEISRIKKQLEWGKVWEEQGNTWRMCMTVKEAMSCCKGKFKGKTIQNVENMLKNVETKTIKII